MGKSTKSRNPKIPKPAERRYDTKMIRDFFDHLMWEWRIMDYENHAKDPSVTNPEFVEMLVKYQRKYNCAGLALGNVLARDEGMEESEYDRAMPILQRRLAGKSEAVLAMLEALTPVMDEALMCGDMASNVLPCREIPASVVLAHDETEEE